MAYQRESQSINVKNHNEVINYANINQLAIILSSCNKEQTFRTTTKSPTDKLSSTSDSA